MLMEAEGFAATNPWNNLQSDLQIPKLVTLNELRILVKSQDGRNSAKCIHARCIGEFMCCMIFL